MKAYRMTGLRASTMLCGVFLLSATGGGASAAEFYQTSTPGATGDIRAAELPPEPGLYAIGGVWSMKRDQLSNGDGDAMFPDTDESLLQGQVGGLWVYPGEFLGGRMASSLIFAYGKHDLTVTNTLPVDLSQTKTGFFDAYSDLFFWSKSWYDGPPPASPGQPEPTPDYVPPMPVGFTLGLGLGVSMPIGLFDNSNSTNLGASNWVISPNIAFTYRTDPILLDATEFSTRIFYNHNFDREDATGGYTYRDGDYLSADFAVTERYSRFQFGLAGNVRWQIEDDEGTPAVPALDGQRHESVRIGPVLAIDFPEYRSTLSFKFLTDVYSRNAFDGNYLQVGFIRKIW